ncbi:Peroxin-3-domain-containing protein [Gymnopilus junonius]|uniref:Peroxin-3-domain-containing protein n=1 Tax=Gymnopilus junonius TaxID=109634 RepID=A0A9P5NKV2_GYMJU|nr:Peroxin-3-domain-containing protein [Gymnopilus junonius]
MGEQPARTSFIKNVAYGLAKTTTVVGSFYAVRGYMRDRLEEVKLKMEDEERAKDVLRTRFQQTQQDTSYTILALMPTLSTQVMQHMDVDALTRELQARSRARTSRHIEMENARAATQPPTNATQLHSRPPSSLSSAGDIVSPALIYPPNPYPISNVNLNINTTTQHPEADARSDGESVSHTSSVASELGVEDVQSPATTTSMTGISSSFISDSGSVSRSWMVDSSSVLGSDTRSALERSRSPAAASVSNSEQMSESVISITTNTSSADSEMNIGINDTRSKAELWNEVKMLTLTRTLTTLYSSTLLCLFTTLQLTLLARGRYVSSVVVQSKDERRREKLEAEMPSVVGLIVRSLVIPARLPGSEGGRLGKVVQTLDEWFASPEGDEDEDLVGSAGDASLLGFERLWDRKRKQTDEEEGWGFGWRSSADKDNDTYKGKGKGKAPVRPQPAPSTGAQRSGKVEVPWTGEITEDLENKYLTMSWWLLHVGWKDVGERVRRGVEEVFDGVSLKTKLASVDLHRLISDVRRRVEYEITFEGNEKRTNFLSSLLPPTPETIHHVLTQGGYIAPAFPAELSDPFFDAHQQSLNWEIDLQLRQSAITHTSHEASSAGPSSSRHRVHAQEKSHTRSTSGVSEKSTSIESSQLSYNFVNSPAMAVSTRYGVPTQSALYPGAPQYIAPSSLPPQQTASSLLDPAFLSLLEETRGILSSPDFVRVLEVCLDRAMEVLFESLENNVFARADDGGDAEALGVHESKHRIRLAGLLPGLARWSQLALDGLPNELVDKILDLREVSCLSAISFARFEERFGA